jgi:hypothetical protein
MSWDPLMTSVRGLKLRLSLVKTRAGAQREFDEFVASNPGEDALELGSAYLAWTIYEPETAS